MSDLIRREDAIEALTEIITNLKTVYGDMGSAVNGARECIKSLPSAKPERTKGEWNEIIGTSAFLWLRCSECGYGNDRKTNFCPNCGAKMTGCEDEL